MSLKYDYNGNEEHINTLLNQIGLQMAEILTLKTAKLVKY